MTPYIHKVNRGGFKVVTRPPQKPLPNQHLADPDMLVITQKGRIPINEWCADIARRERAKNPNLDPSPYWLVAMGPVIGSAYANANAANNYVMFREDCLSHQQEVILGAMARSGKPSWVTVRLLESQVGTKHNPNSGFLEFWATTAPPQSTFDRKCVDPLKAVIQPDFRSLPMFAYDTPIIHSAFPQTGSIAWANNPRLPYERMSFIYDVDIGPRLERLAIIADRRMVTLMVWFECPSQHGWLNVLEVDLDDPFAQVSRSNNNQHPYPNHAAPQMIQTQITRTMGELQLLLDRLDNRPRLVLPPSPPMPPMAQGHSTASNPPTKPIQISNVMVVSAQGVLYRPGGSPKCPHMRRGHWMTRNGKRIWRAPAAIHGGAARDYIVE